MDLKDLIKMQAKVGVVELQVPLKRTQCPCW